MSFVYAGGWVYMNMSNVWQQLAGWELGQSPLGGGGLPRANLEFPKGLGLVKMTLFLTSGIVVLD